MGGGRQTPECVPDISIQISNLLKMFLETSISKMVDNNTQPFFFYFFYLYLIIIIIIILLIVVGETWNLVAVPR